MSKDVVIVAAARTAVGSFGGTLAGVPAHQLGASVVKNLLERTGLNNDQIDTKPGRDIVTNSRLARGKTRGDRR